MAAMEMTFPYGDPEFLEKLKFGDQVEGTLRVVKEGDVVAEYELLGLEVTKPQHSRSCSRYRRERRA